MSLPELESGAVGIESDWIATVRQKSNTKIEFKSKLNSRAQTDGFAGAVWESHEQPIVDRELEIIFSKSVDNKLTIGSFIVSDRIQGEIPTFNEALYLYGKNSITYDINVRSELALSRVEAIEKSRHIFEFFIERGVVGSLYLPYKNDGGRYAVAISTYPNSLPSLDNEVLSKYIIKVQ